MMNNKIQMPANYVALSENEQSCVEGGGTIARVCYAFGRMFKDVYWDYSERKLEENIKNHGAVVSQSGKVITYSDGYTYTEELTWHVGFTSLGNFFDGIGDLFAVFGL